MRICSRVFYNRTDDKKKVSNKQGKHSEFNVLDVPRKSKTGDVGVFEQMVYSDVRVSDVRAGTF